MFNCVKCGLNHPTDNCPKAEETPPRCVNCLQHHTANYKGCQVYRNLLKKKYEYRRNNTNNQTNYQFNSEHFPSFNNNNNKNFNKQSENNQFTYAQTARNNTQQEQNILKPLETFMKQQNELTNKLLSMMQLIITKLCV